MALFLPLPLLTLTQEHKCFPQAPQPTSLKSHWPGLGHMSPTPGPSPLAQMPRDIWTKSEFCWPEKRRVTQRKQQGTSGTSEGLGLLSCPTEHILHGPSKQVLAADRKLLPVSTVFSQRPQMLFFDFPVKTIFPVSTPEPGQMNEK